MAARVFPGTISSVHDGDGLRVLADVGFSVAVTVDVRLAGINAIELAAPGGLAARDHLAGLAPAGTQVALTTLGPDKFGGRWSGRVVRLDGVDVAQQMVADGYAAPWDGRGAKPVPPWPITPPVV